MKGRVDFDKLCEWDVDDKTRNLFLTIYVHCNEKGEWITSRKEIAELTGMTDWDVRSRLSKMNGSPITLQKLSKLGSHITLTESEFYTTSKTEPLQILSKYSPNTEEENSSLLPFPQTPNSSNTLKEEDIKKTNTSYSQKNQEEEQTRLAAKRLYDIYPSKDKISGRPTGKSLKKDLAKIERMLKMKTYTEEKLSATIRRYLEESEQTQSYIKNFSTFLNNIPDYDDALDIYQATPQKKEDKFANYQ